MKKGFTLIELLAVIVILAIIALIATPIILGIINNTKEEANKRSVEMYAKAVENAIAQSQLKNIVLSPGVYNVNELPENFEIKYDGDIECETIGIGENGNVYVSDCETGGTPIEYTSGDKMYKNGEIVYFDVTEGEKCPASEYTEAQSAIGIKSGCMKFYAFNDTGKHRVNLILDHNTSATIQWLNSTTISNMNGPITALEQLYNDTKSWNGTETLEDYTMDQRGRTSNAYYTIEYSKTPSYSGATEPFKARLIEIQEIVEITRNTNWNEATTSSFYFDTNTSTASPTCKSGDITGCKYGWLYDRTYTTCEDHGCLNNSDSFTWGYFTSSSSAHSSSNVWIVDIYGGMVSSGYSAQGIGGIRPVIEVLKSKLS